MNRAWVWWIFGCLVGAVAMFLLIEAGTPSFDLSSAVVADAWRALAPPLGKFLLSPGFGGTAAFLAAGVTLLIARQRLRHERDIHEEDAQDSRWWDVYRLLLNDDSIVSASDQGAEMTLVLQEAAATRMQKQAVLVLVELYVGKGDDGELPS